MLLELSIKDFAIIESLSIGFGPGLNIFTGSTGAGKSIIMDALALVLGDRASGDLIREGSVEAQVEALFDVSGVRGGGLDDVLTEAGFPASDELVIKRVVQRAGRNRIYINGSLSTLVTLTEVGRRLIDIYGQSEHQSLARSDEHVEVLDSFGGLSGLRTLMASAYRDMAEARRELEALLSEARGGRERKDFLSFQLNELSAAGLKPGEEEELKSLRERLQSVGKLREATEFSERAIYSDSGSITERLGAVARALKEVSSLDERLKDAAARVEASLLELEDTGAFFRDYASSIEADPDALEAASERLDLIGKLKKKYGGSVDEMLLKKEALEKELGLLENTDLKQAELEARYNSAHSKAAGIAGDLHAGRLEAAKGLKAGIEEELTNLGMKGALFEPLVEKDMGQDGGPRLTEKGSDKVSFHIAANEGEGLKPLSKVASGGELSRIMLAIKSVISAGRVPTMVFDEIDTGVSGAISQVVGLKLKKVSKANQVLCITHLPQVAAFADRHFAVSKEATGGRTVTRVREVSGEDRVDEISSMLGGLKVTETTKKHALELMEAADKLARPGKALKKS
ncbi:MAG: DNA repair protein RecN [Deltaproteobacteria bacterium]|nr:DNA repair protein RecN [Deltaproteobacteria bacterium]MBZ0221220.1 DNA repair protein RecN [Deltaproteobacteria bacterium]